MKEFKFLNGDCQPVEELPRPVLENEQIIRYWNDGDFHNILYERIIAWARGIHVFADNWIEREYEGTLERFFYNRLEIPVVRSIQLLVDDGDTFTEDHRIFFQHIHFHFPVKIIYYEYVPF